MKIDNVNEFISYYSKIKKRTQRLLAVIPEDKLEWTFREGKFTIGDQIRHIANLERYMFAENVQFKQSSYAGCGIEYANGLENVIAYYNEMYAQSLQIFEKLSEEDLYKKCRTPGNAEISVWKWLRAMVEHEVHHRAQIYLYLSILELDTPPMYGLSSEQVIENSKTK